jgi:hypothetical protein
MSRNGSLGKKRRTVITLSHSNQPAPMQLFAAGLMRGQRAAIYFDGGRALDVLALF